MADTYRERRQARAERLRSWAESREAKATAAFDSAREMADQIPFGQPILAGHHSEGRDRRYRDRIAGKMDAGIGHAAKAERMAEKASNIEAQLDAAIYDDDPDAIEQLEAKIGRLEAERARIVAYNKTCRKGAPDLTLLDDRQRQALASVQRFPQMAPANGSMPAYATANLSGTLSQARKRLERLRGV